MISLWTDTAALPRASDIRDLTNNALDTRCCCQRSCIPISCSVWYIHLVGSDLVFWLDTNDFFLSVPVVACVTVLLSAIGLNCGRVDWRVRHYSPLAHCSVGIRRITFNPNSTYNYQKLKPSYWKFSICNALSESVLSFHVHWQLTL